MDVETIKQYYTECCMCVNTTFKIPEEFADHLRNNHCSQEGGSFVCLYGENQVCSSLPVEGVNDADYEKHIYKHHIFIKNKYLYRKRQTSSTTSLSDLSIDVDKWNVYSASQNLAAILNNPNKIKQKDFFTKLWGEGFSEVGNISDPSYLRNITSQNFDPYLKKLAKRYRRRAKLKKRLVDSSRENSTSLEAKSLDKLKLVVPNIFLQEKFHLSSAETFNTVYPDISDFIRTPDDSHSKKELLHFSSKSRSLQGKLSSYLDIVEVQIAKQVSLKSDVFFDTMTSHDALMENLNLTISKVGKLRSKIQSIDSNLVKHSLKILKGVRSRNNYSLVLRKLKIMATVYQTQPTVKLLLSTPDYVAALDLIYTTKDLLNNELAGIQCFRHVSSELNEVIKMIDALMTGELERYASTDLNRPFDDSKIDTIEKDKLLCIIMGMLRRQCFSFVDSYWRELYSAIKTCIKQTVIEIVAASDSPIFKNTNNHNADALTLDEQLQLLTVEEWVTLLRNTEKSLTILLGRIKSVNEVVEKAVAMCATNNNNSENNLGETESFLDEESQKIINNKLSHLINSACQYASERYAHLLSKRSLTDDVEKYNKKNVSTINNNWIAEQATLEQLNEISNYVDNLCATCQKLNPNDSVFMTLKSAFKTEATKFVKKFHEERLKKIDMILENESWKQTQVPQEFQSLVNQIIINGKFTTYKAGKNMKNINVARSVLYISEEKFVVVGTVLLLINIIAEYCIRAEDISLSGKCLLRYLVELLQLFNRKSCKLVLAGEAVSEKTGLTKITASNLALLIRALQLLLRLLPQIKTHFTNLLPNESQQTINCLDRVSDELNLHIKDINDKLLSIPTHIVASELKNWEAKPPVPSKAFQNLSKNLKKLHDVISCILTHDDIHNLYRKINIYFKNSLRERINDMNIVNDNGPQHGVIITELIFYLQDLKKLNALPESELNETSMNDLWT